MSQQNSSSLVSKNHDSITPKVSVIINCYNGEKYLKEALDSVYAQSYEDWEIIFWNNASTDNSEKVAKGYNSKLKLYKASKTSPLGEARNLAVEKAQGSIIAFLDCDDIWLPDKLEKQIPYFDDHKIAVVFSDTVIFDWKGNKNLHFGGSIPPQGNVLESILFNNFTNFSTVVIRSSVFKKDHNWFDPTIRQIEDADLLMRIAIKWNFAYCPYVLSNYRVHRGSTTFSNLKLINKEEVMIFDKFKKEHPDLAAQYSELCMNRIHYNHAMIQWMLGNNSYSRKIMSVILFRSMKYSVIYFSMFFPYQFALKIRNLFIKRALLNYSP
jgi:glycosyltransferase involved in cell wall biosynthesis